MRSHDLAHYHERTRTRGVSMPVYWVTRAILQPAMHLYFRLRRIGRANIPAEGPVILASNHRSFLDPWTVGTCLRRPVHFVAKRELFERGRLTAWLLNSLGAYPVRRGESDEETVATSRAILARGGVVMIFPEGTRIRHGGLAEPHRGVGRLALETGAPVVPVAVHGSERTRRGWLIRPAGVRVRCGRPLTYPRVERPSPRLAAEVTARIWPCVLLQWEWLGGTPPVRSAAVVGAGSMGTALAALLVRGGLEVQLGCRTPEQAERIARARENAEHLPGVALPPQVDVRPARELDPAAAELVVLAVPARGLPDALADLNGHIGPGTGVLVVSKGLVPPNGALPTRYVAERLATGRRAGLPPLRRPKERVAWLGGPSHAAEAVSDGAAFVVAGADPDLRALVAQALARAHMDVETTDDVTGAELAGCAKNAATLAAAAAAPAGLNAAGAAAGRIFAEVQGLALQRGARSETFAGLAGAGDLLTTALAAGSRNRRAGELLAGGMPGEEVSAAVGQAAEALDSVPLMSRAVGEAGLDGHALERLSALVEGRIGPDEWLGSVRRRRFARAPEGAAARPGSTETPADARPLAGALPE